MDRNAKTTAEVGAKHGRKRTSDSTKWKSTKKRKYDKGADEGDKEVRPKCKCRNECWKKITDDERKVLFEEYCDLRSLERSRDFHCRFVKEIPVKRSRVRSKLKDGTLNKATEEGSRRTHTNHYFLGEIKVCKQMYLSTFGVSIQTIETSFQKRGKLTVTKRDARGGKTNRCKRTNN